MWGHDCYFHTGESEGTERFSGYVNSYIRNLGQKDKFVQYLSVPNTILYLANIQRTGTNIKKLSIPREEKIATACIVHYLSLLVHESFGL